MVGLLVGILHAQETVHLKNGNFQLGELISQTDDQIVFEFTRSNSNAPTRVTIPWKSIEKIVFTPSTELLQAVKHPDEVSLSVLAKLWDEHADWLSRPESRAAQVGLLYAQKLAQSDAEMSTEQALDLYQEIATNAWSPFHQGEAIRERLKTMLAAGMERDAIREAEKLATENENPKHLLEAKYILAESAFAKLKEIEAENPRWHLDDEVRPKRNATYNQAIDHSLYAFLFYGTEEAAATRGLIHAAKIYEFGKDFKNSNTCIEDILQLYPDSKLAPIAKQHREKLLSKLKN